MQTQVVLRDVKRAATAFAIILVAGLLCATRSLFAGDPETVSLWPGSPPDAVPASEPEHSRPSPVQDRRRTEVTESTRLITAVSQPGLAIYRPSGPSTHTGTALLICPGGGYWDLFWQLEGEEVARWLNTNGITGAILKYRVPRRPGEVETEPARRPAQDAQRAMRLLRSRAGEFGIAPHRIGVIGFSAGGHLAIVTATRFSEESYPPADAIDRISSRPDFVISVYPGYLMARSGEVLAMGLQVPTNAPPAFLAHGDADLFSSPMNSVLMYAAFRHAGIPAEVHVYANTAHDFGVRTNSRAYSAWTAACLHWLRESGLLAD